MKRDFRIDTIKGILIVCVVLGHVIGNFDDSYLSQRVYDFIYMFHMPLFIFVSGIFTHKKDSITGFFKGVASLLLALLIFHCIHLSGMLIAGKTLDITHALVPAWTLWFLLSLVYWRLIVQFCSKILNRFPFAVMVFSVALSLVCGLLPGGHYFSIQRTLHFLPFFLLGYYVGQGIIPSIRISRPLAIIILVLGVGIVAFDILPYDARELIYGANPYEWGRIIAKGYILLCSFALSVSVFSLPGENKLLASIGKDSLIYYLYHSIIIAVLIPPIASALHLSDFNMAISLLLVLLVMLIVAGINKLRVFRFLANPLR